MSGFFCIEMSEKMKVVLHIAEAFGSGVLNYIKNLSKWQSQEYQVYIAYGIRPETPENFKEQFDSNIRFIKVDGFTREIELFNDIKAFKFIGKIVKEIHPDLIHLHSTKAGILGRWAINCNKYNVLYSPHAYSFLMMNCSSFKRSIYRWIEKISDKKGCLTIADIEGEFEASKQVTKNAICIPNGIDTMEMDEIISQAEKIKTDRQRTTICMLGKVVPQKNPELFNKIAKKFPDIDFVWIGAGPLEEKLDSPNIEITGWLTRVRATARIMESDIFLFPSAWESLSIALLEAMYIGKPCVVSRVDGNRDVIRPNYNGYVCDTKEEYLFAISDLLGNKKKAEQYGKQARQDILSKYNVNVMEQEYRVLLSILKI